MHKHFFIFKRKYMVNDREIIHYIIIIIARNQGTCCQQHDKKTLIHDKQYSI